MRSKASHSSAIPNHTLSPIELGTPLLKDKQGTLGITPAVINWRDNTPHSSQFDDYYFSSENGIDETNYVFIEQNTLIERWSALEDKPGCVFTIGETGFGTGLNFLCAWQLWQQQQFQHCRLHFVSVDKFPLKAADLAQACAQWPSLKPFCDELLANYPPLVPGFHTIELAGGRIRLTLIFDDAFIAYQQVTGSIDAWFLDGFTPSRNADMWSTVLFSEIARLSGPATTFATFTAAGVVRKGLESVGFTVEKQPGLGPKREICHGSFAKANTQPSELTYKQKPWFYPPSSYAKPGTATIIGAGIAGASIAHSLATRGWAVRVIEQHESTAQEGSGNPTGITFTKLSQYNNPQNRFYQLAYLYATPLLRRLLSASRFEKGKDWDLNGVVRLAYCDKEKAEQVSLVNSGRWPTEIAVPLTPQESSDLLGFKCDTPALLLKQGGWLRPRDAVNELLNHPNIQLIQRCRVKELVPVYPSSTAPAKNTDHTTWSLVVEQNGVPSPESMESDIVILANSFGAGDFEQTSHLPLRSVRGQVSYVPATKTSITLKHALNYEGYTAPSRDGFHCVGATFHPKAKHTTCEQEDHVTNLTNLTTGLASFANAIQATQYTEDESLDGRVGFRCQTPDYLPMLGPAPSSQEFIADYAPLRKGMLRDPMPIGKYHQGLYVSLAHGSRGITSAPYCAEILANIIMGEVIATDKEVVEALHPARFLIRDIKRRKA